MRGSTAASSRGGIRSAAPAAPVSDKPGRRGSPPAAGALPVPRPAARCARTGGVVVSGEMSPATPCPGFLVAAGERSRRERAPGRGRGGGNLPRRRSLAGSRATDLRVLGAPGFAPGSDFVPIRGEHHALLHAPCARCYRVVVQAVRLPKHHVRQVAEVQHRPEVRQVCIPAPGCGALAWLAYFQVHAAWS